MDRIEESNGYRIYLLNDDTTTVQFVTLFLKTTTVQNQGKSSSSAQITFINHAIMYTMV